jgi:hypothetical protein
MGIKEKLKKISAAHYALKFTRNPGPNLVNFFKYLRFRFKYGYLKQVRAQSYKGRVLIVSFMGDLIESAKFEGYFIKMFQYRGYEPYVVTSRGVWVNLYYKVMGIKNLVYFDDYKISQIKDDESVRNEVSRIISTISSMDDLMAVHYAGVHIGKYICSTMLRREYMSGIDASNPAVRKFVEEYLYESISNTLAAMSIIEKTGPDKMLFLERGYSPFGEFFDLSVNKELDTLQWIGCHKNTAVLLKRYHKGNTAIHPSSLSNKSWETIKNLPWKRKSGEAVKQDLATLYGSGDWYSEVGTQFNTQVFNRQELIQKLELDPNKKVAVIFSHIFWDATFFFGKDLFTDYKEWFLEILKVAKNNRNLNWIVKIHPANVVKNAREGQKGQWAEVKAISEHIGKLPPHIKLLTPDTEINTFSLFSIMDYCLTVRGTVGMEAAIFGIPVLTAGTGRYNGYGFTVDFGSRGTCLKQVAELQNLPKLTEKQKVLAEKFATGTFLLRPFIFHNMCISYTRDATASLKVDYLSTSADDFIKAPAVRDFSDWAIESTDEDYLNRNLLARFHDDQ